MTCLTCGHYRHAIFEDRKAGYAARAVALRPRDATSHDLLGVALLAQGKVSDAVGEFQESLRLNPADTDVQAHLRQARGAR